MFVIHGNVQNYPENIQQKEKYFVETFPAIGWQHQAEHGKLASPQAIYGFVWTTQTVLMECKTEVHVAFSRRYLCDTTAGGDLIQQMMLAACCSMLAKDMKLHTQN